MATEQVAVLSVDTGQPVKSIRELRQTVNKYRDDLVGLDKDTEEYTNTVRKLSDAQSELNRVNIITRQGGGDLVDVLTNTTRVAGNLSAGFTAAQGALALFGDESELLQQTFVKLQAAIALTQGLKGLTGLKNSLIGFNASIKAARLSVATFNTTLLANPFTAIATAVLALVVYFDDWKNELSFVTDTIEELWSSIKELIPGLNDTSTLIDTLTAVINGVATAMIRWATGPLKTIIALIKGDFKGALNELVSSFDLLGNFDDGYTRKAERNSIKRQNSIDEENRKIRLEASQTTKKIIEENEARYGSDFKYTEAGRKLYDKYFEELREAYAEDSEEYRKATNQKLSYDREYNNRAASLQKERTEKERREAAERLRILEDEKAQVEQILKAISNYNLPDIEIRINDLTETYNNQLSLLRKFGEDTTELTRQYNERVNNIRLEAQQEINEKLYQERRKDLNDLSYNNEQSLKEIDIYIIGLQSRLGELEFNLSTAINIGDPEQIELIASQIEDVITQINEFEDEQRLRSENYVESYIETLQEILNSDILSAEERISVQRELNEALYQMTLAGVQAQQEAVNRQIDEQKRLADTEGRILDIRRKQQESYLSSLSTIFNSVSNVLGEHTVANKAFAVAAATIDTYKAAVSALASTPGGVIAKSLAFGAVLGTGIAAVKNILSTKVPGKSDSGQKTSVPMVETYYTPEITPTTEMLKSTEKQVINDQRVYILESDIENSMDKSKTRVSESSF